MRFDSSGGQLKRVPEILSKVELGCNWGPSDCAAAKVAHVKSK